MFIPDDHFLNRDLLLSNLEERDDLVFEGEKNLLRSFSPDARDLLKATLLTTGNAAEKVEGWIEGDRLFFLVR